MISVRVASKKDLFDILKLLSHNKKQLGNDYESTESRVVDEMCVCACVGEKIVGCCSFNMARKYIYLTDLCVDKPYRKKGLSYGLMYACVVEASKIYRKDYDVYISAFANNKTANMIYSKIAYVVNETDETIVYKVDVNALYDKIKTQIK